MRELKKLYGKIDETFRNINVILPIKSVLWQVLRTMVVSIAMFLLALTAFLLVSCSGWKAKPTGPELPPAVQTLLDPRIQPELSGRTYRAYLINRKELESWGLSCEADKTGVREYVESGKEPKKKKD